MRVTQGTIFANADVVARFPIEGGEPGPLDFRWEGEHFPERDTWYLLFVEGDGDLAPVRRGRDFRPLAFTNPVRVDADGDGAFTPPGNFSSPSAVAAVDAVDESGVPRLLGEWVVLEGCARTGAGFLDPGSGLFYLEDATGGVQAREKVGSLTPVARGDRVRVAGFVSQVLGETVVSDALVEILAVDVACPAGVPISTGELAAGAEPLEGRVVRVAGAAVSSGEWPVGGAAGSLTLDDGTGPATLVIPAGVVVPPQVRELPVLGLTALVTQRDFSSPFHSGYRLTLRAGRDLLGGRPAVEPEAGRLALGTAHPNPFRERTAVPLLGAPRSRRTRIEIHDVSGRRVRLFELDAGEPALLWDGTDSRGRKVSAGVYFASIPAEGSSSAVRIVKLD
jgi:hypothetical protein